MEKLSKGFFKRMRSYSKDEFMSSNVLWHKSCYRTETRSGRIGRLMGRLKDAYSLVNKNRYHYIFPKLIVNLLELANISLVAPLKEFECNIDISEIGQRSALTENIPWQDDVKKNIVERKTFQRVSPSDRKHLLPPSTDDDISADGKELLTEKENPVYPSDTDNNSSSKNIPSVDRNTGSSDEMDSDHEDCDENIPSSER